MEEVSAHLNLSSTFAGSKTELSRIQFSPEKVNQLLNKVNVFVHLVSFPLYLNVLFHFPCFLTFDTSVL